MLSRKIAAIGQPHGKHVTVQCCTMLHHFDIMCDSLLPNSGVGMTQRAEFVGMRLPPLILESIGVDGINGESILVQQLLCGRNICWNIPWNMQGDGIGGAAQRPYQSNIFNFLFQVTRLTTDGKTTETGTARAQGPGRNGYFQFFKL
jgi:hypothetical protein